MDFGGIIAGAMAGGGQALQQNAQNQLEQQRQKALQKMEQDFRMDVVDYEQNRADQRSTAEAIAESRRSEAERQAEMARIRARGEQERRTAEREAELDQQYGTTGDTPAKVQEIEYLTRNVTGGDREMATRIAYRTEGDFSYGDAYQMVLDGLENNPRQRMNTTQEQVQQQAEDLYRRVLDMSSFGSGQSQQPRNSRQGSDQSSMFSFRNGNTLTRTPSGGVGELPNPMTNPNVFQSK